MPPKFKRNYDPDARAPERQALLDDHSEDEDFFLKGPSPPRMANDKVGRVQGQVDEVVNIMQDNIGRVMDRGDRLEDLRDKSDDLASNADMFRMKARTLSSNMWWRECKMRIILAVVIIVIVLIIVVPIIVQQTKKP